MTTQPVIDHRGDSAPATVVDDLSKHTESGERVNRPSNARWLRKWLHRQPHQIIGGRDRPYLLRWYVIPQYEVERFIPWDEFGDAGCGEPTDSRWVRTDD